MSSKLWPAAKILESLNYVAGKRIKPRFSSSSFKNIEPATGRLLVDVAESSIEDVNEAVASAKQAQVEWAALSGLDRGRILQAAARNIKENVEELAYWETRDNGKPIYESRIDIEGCIDVFDFFGSAAVTAHGRYHDLPQLQRMVYERHEPLGVCAAIGAWNYPFQTASWKMAPALACGNSIVYKPSPWSPITVTLLAELLNKAGVPDGTCNVVQGGAITGTALCHHPDVAKVSFTGSVPTGLKIQQACATHNLKPVTLELGGKSPMIVFEDADIDNAVTGAMMANWFTQGEVCSNGTRVFVHKSIIGKFTAQLVERTKSMTIGNPYDETTKVGAMITKEHMDKVLHYIDTARKEGAHIAFGGERVQVPGEYQDGYYLSPCIVDGLTDDMTIVKEEIFGAVMAVLPFEGEDEVVKRANNTHFGLAAGLFTKDLRRAHDVAKRLQAGNVYINTFNDVAANVPFGGYKQSGYGREMGLQTMNQYTQVKSVWVNTSDDKIEAF